MTTDRLIQRCLAGDKACQSSLVHQYAPRLLAICRRYTGGDNHHAQDALQETFINIFKYLHTYNSSGSFEGWIKRIAVNCCLTFQRKIRPIHFAEESEMERITETVIPDVYSSLGKEALLDLIKELPESYYLVFNLYVIEGYDHSEIGKMLDISASTSRSTLSRARAKLIDTMQRRTEQYNYSATAWAKPLKG